MTSIPTVPDKLSKASRPQPGLDDNPAKTKAVFSQNHPYMPQSCSKCPFYKPTIKDRLKGLFTDRKKDCYNCPYANKCIERTNNPGFELKKGYPNGGAIYVHSDVYKDKKDDFKAIMRIANSFAQDGHVVRVTPREQFKSEEYKRIYGSLLGTKYEKKCPDFQVDGIFYEYEGYERPWTKKKVGRMLSHGLNQSSYVVIDNTKGASNRFIRKAIMARKKLPGQVINEVWLYEKGDVRLFYKDGEFY
ncbi:MAG: hypothetical protein K5854_08065 [Prevotella sp.]|nr:hypothetical protein [Prevotella sp.]